MIKMSRYAVRAFFMLGLMIFVQIFSVRPARLLSLSNTFDQNSHCVEFSACAEPTRLASSMDVIAYIAATIAAFTVATSAEYKPKRRK